MRQLILVGGGGHCKSVIDAAESAGYIIKGILDLPCNVGLEVLGHKVIGTDNEITQYVHDCDFVVTLGFIKDPTLRVRLHENILFDGGRFATIIASTAYVSKYATVGEGSVILHHAMVNAGAKVGKYCILNSYANVGHDATIGDYCHISTGTIITGDCNVGKYSFIGSQSVMVNGKSICEGCVIGAGSVITKDITQRGVYVGNPSRIIKSYNNIEI